MHAKEEECCIILLPRILQACHLLINAKYMTPKLLLMMIVRIVFRSQFRLSKKLQHTSMQHLARLKKSRMRAGRPLYLPKLEMPYPRIKESTCGRVFDNIK